MRTSAGSGEGVDGPSETDQVSEEATDVDEFLDEGWGVAARIDPWTTVRDDVGISMGSASETVDEILIPEVSFCNFRLKIAEEPQSKSNTHRIRSDILAPFQLSSFGCLYQPQQVNGSNFMDLPVHLRPQSYIYHRKLCPREEIV